MNTYLNSTHRPGMHRAAFILLYTVVASAAVVTSRELAEPRSEYFWPVLPMLFALCVWRDYSLI